MCVKCGVLINCRLKEQVIIGRVEDKWYWDYKGKVQYGFSLSTEAFDDWYYKRFELDVI